MGGSLISFSSLISVHPWIWHFFISVYFPNFLSKNNSIRTWSLIRGTGKSLISSIVRRCWWWSLFNKRRSFLSTLISGSNSIPPVVVSVTVTVASVSAICVITAWTSIAVDGIAVRTETVIGETSILVSIQYRSCR